jgi:hypothetical protein
MLFAVEFFLPFTLSSKACVGVVEVFCTAVVIFFPLEFKPKN